MARNFVVLNMCSLEICYVSSFPLFLSFLSFFFSFLSLKPYHFLLFPPFLFSCFFLLVNEHLFLFLFGPIRLVCLNWTFFIFSDFVALSTFIASSVEIILLVWDIFFSQKRTRNFYFLSVKKEMKFSPSILITRNSNKS